MFQKALNGQNYFLGIILISLLYLNGIISDWLLFDDNQWILKLIAYVLSAGIAWSLNATIIQSKFLGIQVLYPAFFSSLILCNTPHLENFLPQLSATLLIIFLVRIIHSLFNDTSTYVQDLNIGLLCGVLFYINPVFIIILLMAIWGLNIVKTFEWRDLIIPIIGFAAVYYIRTAYLFFFEDNFSYWDVHFSLNDLSTYFSFISFNDILFLPFLACLIISFMVGVNRFEILSIKDRAHIKIWNRILIALIIGFVLLESVSSVYELSIILSAPITFIISAYFHTLSNKKITNFILIIISTTFFLLKYNLFN